MDLEDKSYECLKPKIAAYNNIAITVAKEIVEKNFSNQLIKNPLSNNSSSIDSSKMRGMMNKNCNQFPFRFPNLDTALSDDESGVIENG